MRRNATSILKFVFVASGSVALFVLLIKVINQPIQSPIENQGSDVFLNSPHQSLPKKVFHIQDNLRIDWHDYKAIESDEKRRGYGEQGRAATLEASDDALKRQLYDVNGFNALLSDKIALDRSIPDIRNPGCKSKKYLKDLPTVSVIVPFHNEHWSTLLRTAQSVLNRSPKHLLQEILLVDDCSTKDFLKDKLDKYVAANMTKVRIIHLPRRSGLILARLAGAKEAVGEVLLFLDSHTEANVNWLPPLLEPIALDYKTCMCPFIDVIAFETFEYRAQDEGARGAFDWEFYYKRLPLLPEDKEHPAEPFKSPVMAGGLFAISTKFFWELGGYDDGLDIWGGEQYELSFKIWQCGGQMYDAPCSRVGHIYRKFAPFPNPGRGDFIGKNYKRVAEVWMDEYKEFLYLRRPQYRTIDTGDLTAQRAIRENLKCKPFKWFMETIAFDLPLKYPPIEPPDFAKGEIRSIAAPDLCVDTSLVDNAISVKECYSDKKNAPHTGDQNFTLSWHKDIRLKGKTICLDVSVAGERAPIVLYSCHGAKGNQMWRYDTEHQWVIHGGNPRCLDFERERHRLYVSTCNKQSKTQKWRFEIVDAKALSNWDSIGPP